MTNWKVKWKQEYTRIETWQKEGGKENKKNEEEEEKKKEKGKAWRGGSEVGGQINENRKYIKKEKGKDNTMEAEEKEKEKEDEEKHDDWEN